MRNLAALVFISAIVLGLGPASRSSWALSDAEIADQVQFQLDQRHPKDTPEWWRGLGSNAPSVIISMYEKDKSTYHRVRLVDGLGYFDDAKAVDFLKNLALNSDQDVIQNEAIKAIGLSQGARESEFLSRFLSSADPSTRFAAADSLQGIYDRTHDSKAKELLDKYRKEEKVPWVLAKLRGELPQPKGGLTPVATSEDRNSQNLEGTWKGYLVSPLAEANKGMKSEPAVLRIQGDSPESTKGDLVLKLKGKFRAVTLSKISWKAPRSPVFSGSWTEGKETISFEGEVSQQAGAQLLSIRISQVGATLIVRKEPTSR